jgi:hypothetical protein
MSKFPLYDDLIKNTPSTDLTIKSKNEFLSLVDKIDPNGQEVLYILIKIYQIEHDENHGFTIPYNGSYVEQNINFDLDKLPNKLKQLLLKFLKTHVNSLLV